MSAQSTILAGRAFNEKLMRSTCVITRGTGVPVLNETTGFYDTATATTIYTGVCKLRFNTTVVSEQDYVSQLVVEQDAILSLPVVGSENVTVDDIATITTSPIDTALVGKRFRVAGFHGQTFATARRLSVELVSNG